MRKNLDRIVLFSSCFTIMISLCSWGFYVHETATQLAVYQLPKNLRRFFFSNIDSLTTNAIRPDKRRYTDKNESAKHFIDIENYGENAINTMPLDWQTAVAKYSLDTLKRYGYVPYQILIEYDSLVNAFKQKNADSIIFYADDVAHYIEDANVPLHTTNNYDGQLTNQKGLHALWESAIPELELSTYNLHSKHKATYIKNKPVAIWNAVRSAHALLPKLFQKEKEVAKNFTGSSKYIEKMYYGKKTKVYTNTFAKQYAAALGSTINDQLIKSSAMVADFWFSAWVDAGKPNLKGLYQFNKKDKKKLCKELKASKKNDLLKTDLLRAGKE
ncbi:MAG: zinc dependent phospholipase C family protein [Parafilimonas sp.]